MIVLIMDDATWSVLVYSKKDPYVLQAMTTSAWGESALTNHQIDDMVAQLAISTHRQDTLVVGLSHSYYQTAIFPMPAELLRKDHYAYCQIKMAKLLNVTSYECLVDYVPLTATTLYAIGCRRSLLMPVRMLAKRAKLSLQVMDLTVYGLLASIHEIMPRWFAKQAATLCIVQQPTVLDIIKIESNVVTKQYQQPIQQNDVSGRALYLQRIQRDFAVSEKDCWYIGFTQEGHMNALAIDDKTKPWFSQITGSLSDKLTAMMAYGLLLRCKAVT